VVSGQWSVKKYAISGLLVLALIAPASAQRFGAGNEARREMRQQRRMERQQRGRAQAGEWLRRYKDKSPQEQEKALNSDPEFQKLPPERQQKLRERLREFNQMAPQKQERVLDRMQQFEQLTPQQRQQARALQGEVKDVPQERRQQMRIALRNLRQMDAEQRERVMNSDRFKERFNDHERDILKGMLALPIGPGAEQPAAAAPK